MAVATANTRTAAQALAALGQPSRLGALQVLAGAAPGGVGFAEMAMALGVTQASLSKHLRVLEAEGLIVRRQDGAAVVYAARAEGLAGLEKILADVSRALRVPAHR